ncbi:MAG: beta-ketoacyl-ACP synthase 3 [Opitutus sp.]|nr:beta-ketoacyl-ACP synthase 3 [Opitutus sp.]MCS6246307.1 beta-ketoacyl-ACP synthase 3 [Opitutus sp.]MCS6273067.1 beta-ketoacyl-ACP synthase 3 [Opitutus sp.]MCS6277896.1 beta-ketoacyl-ACP synthase 3 [Opitutus sp.]MCS6298997.1 beta-ketoacyl-ACP synthase 3 [Opitutus sp.]
MDTFLIDVPIPSMGATVSELTVIDIKVAAGARISKGDKIAELESDKSVFEFEAPCDGVIEVVQARAGDILPSGSPFLRISTTDISLKNLQVKAGAATPVATAVSATKSAPAAAVAPVASPAVIATPVQKDASPAAGIQWTPRAAKLAQEAGLDPASIVGIEATGPGGRVSGDDITRYLANRPAASASGLAALSAQSCAPTSAPAETVCIAGIGYAVPKNVRATSEILKAFPGRTEAEMLKLTGIKERRYADADASATSLAAIAVNHALTQAGMTAAQIDGIILATIIPDQPVPSMASALAKHLGCNKALAFDVNAACSGWLYALEVGRAFIRGGTAKNVIVVTAELLSRITNPNDHETAFLFGDGAGAAILTDAPGGHRLHRMALSGDAAAFEAIQRPGGGARQLMPNADGSDRGDFFLQMDGGAVFKSAVIAFANEIENAMTRHGLTPADISWIVPHQANERILRAVGKRVGIPFEKFVVTIAKYGNTSGASVSMALGWAAEEGIFKPDDKIIFCSVGAGLTFAGGLLVW